MEAFKRGDMAKGMKRNRIFMKDRFPADWGIAKKRRFQKFASETYIADERDSRGIMKRFIEEEKKRDSKF